jgi:hypothetical protein
VRTLHILKAEIDKGPMRFDLFDILFVGIVAGLAGFLGAVVILS